MANPAFLPIYGRIQRITNQSGDCCQQMVSVMTDQGIVNLLISPATYVIDSVRLRQGMTIAAFYDGNAPVPLIFPPQYRALIIGQRAPRETVTVQYFNRNLVAADNSLILNPGPSTDVTSSNGQRFTCSLGNRMLIVYYTTTTRSIPPQTTPSRIIVMC